MSGWKVRVPPLVSFLLHDQSSECYPKDGRAGIQVIGIPKSTAALPQSSAPSKNIVYRPCRAARGYQICIRSLAGRLTNRGFCVALRGSPGIGTSWSALLCIRMLMGQKENRRPIIYELGTSFQKRTTYLIYPNMLEKDGDEGKATNWPSIGRFQRMDDIKIGRFVIDPPQFPPGVSPQASGLIGAMGDTSFPRPWITATWVEITRLSCRFPN